MDRFQILKNQDISKPYSYMFKSTTNPQIVCEYIQRCIKDEVNFHASNIYPSVIDRALVLLNKEKRITILTKTDEAARTIMLAYRLKAYSLENPPPESINRVVCYYDLKRADIPPKYDILLRILRDENKR